HPPQGKHNALQKYAYLSLPVLAAAAVVTGVAIWKPVQLGWLTRLLGGYVWARYWHFLAMLGLVAVTFVHIFMVFSVDPYSIPAMITGRYREDLSPQRRNARPFRRLSPRSAARAAAREAAAEPREAGEPSHDATETPWTDETS
ncbi:MAG TPA: cytochrome b/b6 domain-containing protein, partial [Gemmatimonadota bacterium]|nr:cytochrome b/b6 domain-containing protein [Gemmatimonadota bacterium]